MCDASCCRLEVTSEVLGLDAGHLKEHSLQAQLYRDSPDLASAQPVLQGSMPLVVTGPSSSDRMKGSSATWIAATAQVSLNNHVLQCNAKMSRV